MKIILIFLQLFIQIAQTVKQAISINENKEQTFNTLIEIETLEYDFNVFQNQNNYTYKLNFLRKPVLKEFYHVEIIIQSNSVLMDEQSTKLMVYNQIVPPYKINQESSIIGMMRDNNGNILNKQYHHLVIDTLSPEFNRSEEQFISFIISENSTYSYILMINEYNQFPCANDCTNPYQGICNIQERQCDCNVNFIDEDCSVSAQNLFFETPYYFYLRNSQFFSYQPKKDQDIEILVKLNEKGQANVSIKKDGIGSAYLPSSRMNDITGPVEYEKDLIIFVQSQYLQKDRLIILFEVPFNVTSIDGLILIRTPESEENNNSLMIIIYILICVVVVIVFTIILVFQTVRINSNIIQSYWIRVQLVYQADANQPKLTLSKADIDKFMPQMKYQECYKILQDEVNCSVCLIEFSTDQDFVTYRKTLCRHIFHSMCLEEWLKKHENCPLCRTNLTKEDFESLTCQMKFSTDMNYIKGTEQNQLLATKQHDDHNENIKIQIDNVEGHDSIQIEQA